MMKRWMLGRGTFLVPVALGLVAGCSPAAQAPKGAGSIEYQAAVQSLERGDPTAAEASLRQAIQSDPANGSYYAQLGEIHLRRKEVEEAVTQLQTAAQLSPDLPHIDCKVARALLLDSRPDEATNVMDAALKKNPRCAEALYIRGEWKRRAGQPQLALADFQEALSVQSGFPPAAGAAGALLLAANKPEEARGVLETGLKVNPADRGLHALLGQALLRSQDATVAATAKEHLRKALPPLPGDPVTPEGSVEVSAEPVDVGRIRLALGQLSFRKGDMADARDEFTRALAGNPSLTEALDGQAQVAEREGHADAAANYKKRSAEAAVKLNALASLRAQAAARPEDVDLQLRAARLALEIGDRTQAAESLEAAVRADPARREVRELRARLYQETGQSVRAAREFRIAYSLPRSTTQ
jgi:Tfp pilus assembly protein PilF